MNNIMKMVEEQKALIKRLEEKADKMPIALAELEKKKISIIKKIVRDNERIVIFNDVMPIAIEVLKKYIGKPYGEKTKDKISAEVKARTNCAFRIMHESYHDTFDITPCDENGYASYRFKYDDFISYYYYDEYRILVGNKITDAFIRREPKLSNCGDFVPTNQLQERADAIIKQNKEVCEMFDKLNDEISKFNDLLPSNVPRKSIYQFRNYLEV